MSRLPPLIRSLVWRYRVALQAVTVSVLSYGTALITTYVGNVAPGKDNKFVIGLGGLIVVLLMTIISTLIDKVIQDRERTHQREHNIHKTGFVTLNREINNYIQVLREFSELNRNQKLQKAIELMQNAVTQLYETLETEHGTATSVEDHIEFEVTFMTTSLRDEKITIAAWANRDGRAPKSLAKRGSNPDIYAETETAKLYADENRTIRIISSTRHNDYKELYPGQKLRIQSSIVYPVLDDASALLGTLVVHCDKDQFFRQPDSKIWRELIEPYTKRLALARTALNILAAAVRPEDQPF